MHNTNHKKPSIYNPHNEIIYVHKQRPLIFNQQYNEKHKKKTFQTIYNNPIFNQLSFLISSDYQLCQCENNMKECQKLKDILREMKKHEAKMIFQKIEEHKKQLNSQSGVVINYFDLNEVLQPHFNSLMSVLNVQNPSIVTQMLKHTKTDYATFWIYGLYISKFPQFSILSKNIVQIVQQKNLDVDPQKLLNPINGDLKIAYEWKLLNMFRMTFASIVNIVCQKQRQQRMIEKLIICYYIKGRQRKQFQVIKAALQMDSY